MVVLLFGNPRAHGERISESSQVLHTNVGVKHVCKPDVVHSFRLVGLWMIYTGHEVGVLLAKQAAEAFNGARVVRDIHTEFTL